MNGDFSRRERQLMEILYARGEASVAEIHSALSDPEGNGPSYNSVRKLLSILEEKGHLTHKEAGRQYIYAPARSPKSAARSALRGLLGTFFGGSPRELMATLLNDDETAVSPTELEALEALIAAARKESDDAPSSH
jgi:BlaI family transcriptional regulator, penicillinase repressor